MKLSFSGTRKMALSLLFVSWMGNGEIESGHLVVQRRDYDDVPTCCRRMRWMSEFEHYVATAAITCTAHDSLHDTHSAR